MADPPFRDVSLELGETGNAVADKDLLEFYSQLPKEERSHEQYEELIDMVRLLWHHKNYLEREVFYLKQEKLNAVDANGEMLTIMTHIARKTMKEDGPEKKIIKELVKEYNKGF